MAITQNIGHTSTKLKDFSATHQALVRPFENLQVSWTLSHAASIRATR